MARRAVDQNGNAMHPKERVRLTCTVDADTAMRVAYWAERYSETQNDYMANAIEAAIAHENHDWRLEIPDEMTSRINELNAHIIALETTNRQLMDIMVQGFTAITDLARGDTYLESDEPAGDAPVDASGPDDNK